MNLTPKTHKWMVADRVPITPLDDPDSRSIFMYQLRHPNAKNSHWANKLDSLILQGSVLDLEIKETFDSIKIYIGLLLAVLSSLAIALAYGFVMENDFSTGFSIASWIITAFGFLAAVIAASEYFGLEKPTATFQPVLDLEAGGMPFPPPSGGREGFVGSRNPFAPIDLPPDLRGDRYRTRYRW